MPFEEQSGSGKGTGSTMVLDSILAEIDRLRERLNMARLLERDSVRDALLVEYAYESNRIEGNTLTLRETDLVFH